ncbi:MAG TPA: type II toxin-antitoxin system Phd/YefM family antitoxin [Anaerolineae bacterium]|nr:type II toxin-antitoxin system Phd/YefM family antitoxin [Anaerolineae bacterium]
MLRTISSSNLRSQIKRVLNDVGYGQNAYMVKKFGEPIAAIISIEDYILLQESKKRQVKGSLQKTLRDVRARNESLDLAEINDIVEAARNEIFNNQNGQINAD